MKPARVGQRKNAKNAKSDVFPVSVGMTVSVGLKPLALVPENKTPLRLCVFALNKMFRPVCLSGFYPTRSALKGSSPAARRAGT